MFFQSWMFAIVFLISANAFCLAAEPAKPDPKESISQQLNLNRFEAVMGSLSACAGDFTCLDGAKTTKKTLCAADACEHSKDPIDCFDSKEIPFNSLQQKGAIMDTMCAWLKSPSPATRQALLKQIPTASEHDLVGQEAFFLALKGSAAKCQEMIKNYIGAYGPTWTPSLYSALSGCRMLAHETTRDQEEKSFLIWFGVTQGAGKCSDIPIPEMQTACSTPGAVLTFRGGSQSTPVK